MPSQEDNFDKLLKDLSEDMLLDEPEDFHQALSEDGGLNGEPDDLRGLSEEDIAVRLAAAQDGGALSGESMSMRIGEDDLFGDVLDMPEEAEDRNVREIQDLLKKSDRNELIDSRTGDMPDGESQVNKLLADIENGETEAEKASGNRREMKALEKKRLKEEKAAAKKAAKEAARAEKEEKRRKKKRKKGEAEAEEIPSQNDQVIEEYDLLADKDLLDSIVSGAGRLDQEEERPAERLPEEEADISGEEDIGAQENSFSDIIALDMDEIDNYIPDVSREPEEEEKPQKKGLLSKFVGFLMEEEEETGNEDVKMSEENQEILDELDREKAGKSNKAKKPKKEKKKKEKKKKEPKPQKQKPQKPKKEKKPKEPENYIPGKRLTFKKMLPIFLLGATVGAVVFIFVNLSVDYSVRKQAEAAFEAGDYQNCYLKLFGRKLDEEEALMYAKSECILHMQMRYQEYVAIAGEGSEAEILDNLIQIVNDYPGIYDYALQNNAAPEVYEIYTGILNILNLRYGLTEEQAREIAEIDGNIRYTKAIYAVIEGRGYGTDKAPEEQMPQNPADGDLDGKPGENGPSGEEQDLLPEEEEIGTGDFIDGESGL